MLPRPVRSLRQVCYCAVAKCNAPLRCKRRARRPETGGIGDRLPAVVGLPHRRHGSCGSGPCAGPGKAGDAGRPVGDRVPDRARGQDAKQRRGPAYPRPEAQEDGRHGTSSRLSAGHLGTGPVGNRPRGRKKARAADAARAFLMRWRPKSYPTVP
ncbi:hypothetical protein Maq22A_c28435 [Methylobacterium aquaticum]|uniref:Uncharacterized protein n=1 Tax=Methylobacterium aquaticum TaxID=270351 RepID=A0A1Y0ZFR6_9HYPH|nr:hypothetical protein Maq22A_c28435 [Methylobacterium aquaticum]